MIKRALVFFRLDFVSVIYCLIYLSINVVQASDVSIKDVDFKNDKLTENRMAIQVDGNLNDNPQVTIHEKILQVIIPNAHLNLKINKKINDTTIIANQLDRSTVSVKAFLPYSLQGKESLVNITLKDGSVDVSFPRIETGFKKINNPILTSKQLEKNNVEAEKLDENYLSKLVQKNERLAAEQHSALSDVNNNDSENTNNKKIKNDIATKALKSEDVVRVTQSSSQKNDSQSAFGKEGKTKSNFSLTSYIGKFAAFLSLMIAGFYGVLTLIKKGVIRKGKLGFLHSTKLVEILSTTHIAPKRSLMIVKAHKQVFLISNFEGGMQLISEINDVSGLIKTGEAEVTGSNFDTNLYKAARKEKDFKIKEDAPVEDYALDDMLNDNDNEDGNEDEDGVGVDKTETHALKSINKSAVKDQVSFSDQIKKKLKHMKQM